MKRLVAIASVMTCAWSTPAGAGAQSTLTSSTTSPPTATSIQVVGIRGNDGTHYDLSGSTPGSGPEAQPGSHRAGDTASAPPVFKVRFPVLVPSPTGGYCIAVEVRGYSTLASAVALDDLQQFRWMLLTRNYELCAGVVAPPDVPAAQAADFWRMAGQDLLPKPQPHIAPGWMLTGKLAYLEADSPTTAHFEHDTPLGPLTIDAHSQVWVDWGDGHGLEGPHDGPGQPWPDGTITHTWTTAAHYDVRVAERWTATWALAGTRGQLAGLATEGRIDAFEVRQLQAVRTG